MIVEKDSATLGYLREITKPLNADHHEVCKYTNQQDSNYKNVRDVLRFMVERFKSKGMQQRPYLLVDIAAWACYFCFVLTQYTANEDSIKEC